MEPENILKPENDIAPKLRTTIDWVLWSQWLLATTIGWIIGLVLGREVGIGLIIGFFQWLVLRRYISKAGWWVGVTALGWAIGWAIITSGAIVPSGSNFITSVFSGALLGLTMGVGQWFLLRRWVNFASMWLLLAVSGWAIALAGLLGSTLVGAIAGAITGFAFDFLLRYPRDNMST